MLMNFKRIYLDKQIFFSLLFVIIVFLEPQSFKEEAFQLMLNVDQIYKILKILCSFYIVYIYIKLNRWSKLVIITIIFQFIGFISTVLNNGDIFRFTGPALTTFVMMMSAEILLKSKKIFNFIKYLNIYFRVCFILNVISIIIIDFISSDFCNGIYFLGIDNRWIFLYLPWICCEFLYSIKIKSKINFSSVLWFVLCEITLVYRFSLAALILMLIWFFIILKPISDLCKNALRLFFVILGVNYLFVFFRIQNLASKLLNSLNKGVTLSGRTYLWDAVIQLINSKPFLGNGMQTLEFDKLFFYNSNPYKLAFLRVSHAHNSFLTIGYRSGYVGLLLYIYILFICMKKLFLNKTNKFSSTIFISILISLFAAVFDTYDSAGFYFILGLAYNINYLE